MFGQLMCREDFTAFAETCSKEFGDRVKFWTAINEANVNAVGAYDSGWIPPGQCSCPCADLECPAGNWSLELYIAVHRELLAHASVCKLDSHKYRMSVLFSSFFYFLFYYWGKTIQHTHTILPRSTYNASN